MSLRTFIVNIESNVLTDDEWDEYEVKAAMHDRLGENDTFVDVKELVVSDPRQQELLK